MAKIQCREVRSENQSTQGPALIVQTDCCTFPYYTMRNSLHFLLNGQPVRLDLGPGSPWRPTTTVLQYLRAHPEYRGVKEGCAEGDCGACTVVLAGEAPGGILRYRAVDSCLVFLPSLDRKHLITIEGLRAMEGALHPVQDAIVRHSGSQCGFCTPGIVMSLFALYHTEGMVDRDAVVDALAGNLCRCTGYRPVVDAGLDACGERVSDHFTTAEPGVLAQLRGIPGEDVLIEQDGQTYCRPAGLQFAQRYRAIHPDAVIINGATDVALRVTKRHEVLPSILDLSGVPELKTISTTSDAIVAGAGVTIEELRRAAAGTIPALADMLAVFGSRQIRNVATLGGNLGTGSPIGDTLPVLLALHADVTVTGPRGERVVPIHDFFTGYRATACGSDELITSVRVPIPAAGTMVLSFKVSRRRELDISTVSAALRLHTAKDGAIDDVVLAYGGMAATPKRAAETERFLTGKAWSRATVEAAKDALAADFTPLDDVRGSAHYRALIARNLLVKFWSSSVRKEGGAR
jgi:xanthine dehydrogenase small subunit